MIYLYQGEDINKARVKANELLNSLQKKRPDASVFKINSENFDYSRLQEYIESQGLFSNKYIVFLDRLCEIKDIKEILLEKLDEIKESENIFIILEGKLDKATLSKIEKKSEKTLKFEIEEEEKKEYNAFALANAFGNKNKKDAWVLYRESIDRGEAPEALHGMIFWKVKSLILSGGNYAWKKEELLKCAEGLIMLYHEARRGNGELETRLEAFLLEN
jgi:DNA polymerase III delta subunit